MSNPEKDNKLICDFLGVKESLIVPGIYVSSHWPHGCAYLLKEMKYRSSWDWQIKAWSKVAHVSKKISVKSDYLTKKHLYFCDRYESAVFNDETEEGFKILIELIQFCNKNKDLFEQLKQSEIF